MALKFAEIHAQLDRRRWSIKSYLKFGVQYLAHRVSLGKSVVLVGSGMWGRNLARVLSELGALSVICDTDSKRGAAIARELGVGFTNDLTEALERVEIRSAVIATPAVTHVEVARKALLAGKHVFVEKPIALGVRDGTELAVLADSKKLTLMVGHLLQYHPVFLKLKELSHSGKFGRIRHIFSNRLNFGLIRSEENVLWSLAPHDISMVLALTGAVPEKVSAVGTTILQQGIPDIATLHLWFADGVRADVSVSWLHPFKEQKVVVVGDEGMAVFSDTNPWPTKLTIYGSKARLIDGRPYGQPGALEIVTVEQGEPLKEEMRHFLNCVETGQVPRTDAEEAISVLSVLQAAQLSLVRHGEWINLHSMNQLGASYGKDVFVHPTAAIDPNVEVGAGSRIWHFSHILGNSRLGTKCVIGQNVVIGPDVTVGSGCKIQNNVSVYKGVTLEDDVFCGPSMVFTNVRTPRAHIERKNEFSPTLVKRGATVGANATIVCGTTIGEYSMIGAGAVVTKDVRPFALVVGNPARQIGWVSRSGERLGQSLMCPRTGERYMETPEGLLLVS